MAILQRRGFCAGRGYANANEVSVIDAAYSKVYKRSPWGETTAVVRLKVIT
jgi:hypothetical protein